MPSGYAPRDGDCNDQDPRTNPGVLERCNGRDDDCNGESDEGWVRIPGGTFTMGNADEPNWPTLRPHVVTVSPFCIQRTEVTVAAWLRCPNCPGPGRDCGNLFYRQRDPAYDIYPVNCISQPRAARYCAWLGARLPTESEWEYAARGTDGRTYPWGNDRPTCAHANFGTDLHPPPDDCPRHSMPVGTRPLGQSPSGVLDMAGNVYEWVSDWYGPYPTEPTTDPTGPRSGDQFVARGGGYGSSFLFSDRVVSMCTWYREPYQYFVESGGETGFRCAMRPED